MKNQEKVRIWWNFVEITILTFVIFVAKISNKQFCKLDKILRNFCSCDILERHCRAIIP